MLDCEEYTIDDKGYQGNGNGYHGNGYDQLEGDFATFYKVARGFIPRVKRQDSEDFLHNLFEAFMKVKTSYDAKGKELTEGGLVRVAQYEVADYWRGHFKRINGVDCSRCSKAQRAKCKEDYLYWDCPKAIRAQSLDELIQDSEGNATPLHELVADNNADFIPRLDAKLILEGYPRRFVQLAYKKHEGYPLTSAERQYYTRELKKIQKTLI